MVFALQLNSWSIAIYQEVADVPPENSFLPLSFRSAVLACLKGAVRQRTDPSSAVWRKGPSATNSMADVSRVQAKAAQSGVDDLCGLSVPAGHAKTVERSG